LINVEPQVGDEEWLRATGTGNGTQGSRRAVLHARPHPSPDPSLGLMHQAGPRLESKDALELEVIELRRRVWAIESAAPPPAAEPAGEQVAELQDRVRTLESELAAARELIGVLQNMKAVRWSEWPRRIVYRLRARHQ